MILEYKRELNENVINQGLFYLDWLMDHKAEFEHLVRKKCGAKSADDVDWSGPRLICIASDFTRYDEHAVQQMGHNVELVRYRHFPGELLLLELVNAATQEEGGRTNGERRPRASKVKGFSDLLQASDRPVARLYSTVRKSIEALGDDVQVKVLKHYAAFKRIKNFACVVAHPNKGSLIVYLKITPKTVKIEKGFTRDVRSVGHFGTGDLEVTLRTRSDLERAKPLIRRSYESS